MIASLIGADRRTLARDPAYAAMLGAPVLIILFLHLALPWLVAFVLQRFEVDLRPALSALHAFFAHLPAYLIGVVFALVLVEERDSGVLAALAVTPLGRGGYIAYRLTASMALATAVTLVVLWLLPAPTTPRGAAALLPSLVVSASIASGAPAVTLALALFAGDKVAALAIAKLMSVVMMLPLLRLLPASGDGGGLLHLAFPVWSATAVEQLATATPGAAVGSALVALALQSPLFALGIGAVRGARQLPIPIGRTRRRRRHPG